MMFTDDEEWISIEKTDDNRFEITTTGCCGNTKTYGYPNEDRVTLKDLEILTSSLNKQMQLESELTQLVLADIEEQQKLMLEEEKREK